VAGQTTGTNLIVRINPLTASGLTPEQSANLRDGDAVFDIALLSGNRAIGNFDGTVTVTLPYAGRTPPGVWYLDEAGKLEKQESRHNSAAGTITFTPSHLSLYLVGFDEGAQTGEWQNPFADVKPDDWFYGDVEYVHKNGLFAGTTKTAFSPNTGMTRAMFATVLARLSGADLSGYTDNRFTDVQTGAWYAASVEWAAANGVVNGVGDNLYAPGREITRQEMAVMLRNYAQFEDVILQESKERIVFNDDAEIASWATVAVVAMQRAGVIGGKPGNLFDPNGTATRAEATAMLHRFILNTAGNRN
jgi:hypothetical protein